MGENKLCPICDTPLQKQTIFFYGYVEVNSCVKCGYFEKAEPDKKEEERGVYGC